MKHYAGLDVSLKETAICVLDADGAIVSEASVLTEPEVIISHLKRLGLNFGRVGLETGSLAAWLYEAMAQAGFPMVCMEARHAAGILKSQPVKTDRNDARGLAQIVRGGWYKPVHVKTKCSQKLRMLLSNRATLLGKMKDIENQIRGTAKVFGLKLGRVTGPRFELRVRELLETDGELIRYVEPLLKVRRVMREEFARLCKMVRDHARDDAVCRRLMTVPGVGPITSLTFRATVDQPERFSRSRRVGAHLGLTPRKYASGKVDYNGGITKCGDPMMRSYLYEAAQVVMRRVSNPSAIAVWGMQIARRSSMKNAVVAVSRKLAVILHRIWVDGAVYEERLRPVDIAA